jgi:hypothetical protein
MRRFTIHLSLLLALTSIDGAWAAPQNEKYSWLLGYKSTNGVVWDKRFPRFVANITPVYKVDLGLARKKSGLADQFLSGLGGPPDDINFEGERYITLSACRLHDCSNKSFLWIDANSEIAVGAIIHYILDGEFSAKASLLVFSASTKCKDLPSKFLRDVFVWAESKGVSVVTRRFVGHSGKLETSCY